MRCEFETGTRSASASRVVNAIPAVCAAAGGRLL